MMTTEQDREKVAIRWLEDRDTGPNAEDGGFGCGLCCRIGDIGRRGRRCGWQRVATGSS
jgi:hypothetical protein